jgi:hypothetical protein
MNSTAKIGTVAGAAGVALLSILIGLPLLVVAGEGGHPSASGAQGLESVGVPPIAAQAYERAADAAHGFTPPCEIPAWLLAGVGTIESGHGTSEGATVDSTGEARPRIIGPSLPRLGADTDDGRWDGDTTADHAVGPMQFIPSTWRAFGLDGNGDGVADPHNIFDAALTAARYLCSSASPMKAEADWRAALLAYNHSSAYVSQVLKAAFGYRDAIAPNVDPNAPVDLVNVPGIGLTSASWAPQVRSLLAAAEADGVHLTGSSYRDPAQQIALRRAHCGTSQYAIYEMPSSRCHPPTARPGTSNHERGLAVDFDRCSSRGSSCYRWLKLHAARFGISNLPSEPWHWSVDGR